MRKAIIVIIMIIFSLFAFGFNLDIGNNISISKNIWEVGEGSNIGLYLSYPLDFSDVYLPGIGINYNDKNEFFTYQKVFFKKIKMKAGERYFNLNIGYENNSILLSSEIKKYNNDLISKSFSYSYTSVFKGGSEKKKISLDKYLIPTVLKASIFSTSYDNSGIGNSISNYGIQLQRYFTIPVILGISDLGYSLSIPIGIMDDKYISGYFAYGVLYNGEYYPEFSFQTPFSVNKKDYYLGIQLKMSSESGVMFYLSKIDINNPFTIIITNNGGSFFGSFPISF
jgi:hypothetical protein